MSGGSASARVFPGLAEQVGDARHWVRALIAAVCEDAADDAELVTAELFANAVKHTRSGDKGGLVTVAVTADGVIHMHDQGGTNERSFPRPAALPDDDGKLPETGRGLVIVAALCGGWEWAPAARCPAARPDEPAARAGGLCICCRPLSWRQPPAPCPDKPRLAERAVRSRFYVPRNLTGNRTPAGSAAAPGPRQRGG
jgi:anti-sigma regulatory factor (Ser/Thr protein kinase)